MIKGEEFEIIIYSSNQLKSRNFYSAILAREPVLDVPGMTEFVISAGLKLGIMPENGIAKILENKTPHPASGNGIPRCELYFYTDNPELHYLDAINHGATAVSNAKLRDWGHVVAYVSDFDGNIIAFAKKS